VRSSAATARPSRAHRAAAPGAGRRQVDPRPRSQRHLRRPQPGRHGADGDRLHAGHAHGGRGRGLCEEDPRHPHHLGTCDGDMEKGNLRADVNVSVCRPGLREVPRPAASATWARAARSRTSTRSASSSRPSSTRRAARSRSSRTAARSIRRPASTIPTKNETRSMRSKEEAHDYRYFPDPDLLPLELDQAWIDEIEAAPARTAGRQVRAPAVAVRPVAL
jgi:hypothetical protein